MKLILTIAWRNILRHKGKSIVIGVILFLGALMMTIGNGVISGMDRGIQKNVVNGFMGDVVLISEKQKTDNVLLSMMGQAIEPISTYKQIKEVLLKQDYVDRFLPAGKNLALVLNENDNTPAFAYLLGVDFAEYRKMFPVNFKALEGRELKPGEKGLLVPTQWRKQLFDYTNTWIIPENGGIVKANMEKDALERLDTVVVSSNIVLMGMSAGTNASTDIRLTTKGIIKYDAMNTIFGHFTITDIESYRECLGYITSADMTGQIPKEEQKLLDMQGDDLDSLFGVDSMVVTDTRSAFKRAAPVKKTVSAPADLENGVYNVVFVKLKPGVSYPYALKRLNKALGDAKTGVRAITWNKASGPIGSMALIIRSALFLFVTLLFFVAIIIIVNTLTMAALERTSELGMMRAIGARKSFISGMFLGETAMLSAVFGGAGIALGVIVIKLIPLFKITSTNDIVQMLYGGDVFSPVLGAPDILVTVLQLVLVTVLAALYPMKVARSITPLDAISRD